MKNYCWFLLLALFLSSICSPALAERPPVYNRVIFVNGINVTHTGAALSARKLQEKLDSSTQYLASERRYYRVQMLWNPNGWWRGIGPDGVRVQDLSELFFLKTREEISSVDYRFGAVRLHVNAQAPAFSLAPLKRIADSVSDLTPGNTGHEAFLMSQDINADELMEPTRVAIERLSESVKDHGPAIIVAHSQGNLLANLAYARIMSEAGTGGWNRARLVNVANTSEFSMHGLSLTHREDVAVYEFLPNLAKALNSTRTTPVCSGAVCEFRTPIPSVEFQAHGGHDAFKHFFESTYLSGNAITSINADQLVDFRGTIASDRLVDLIYSAARSMEVQWWEIFAAGDPAFPGDGLSVAATCSSYVQIFSDKRSCFALSRVFRASNYIPAGGLDVTFYSDQVESITPTFIAFIVSNGKSDSCQRRQPIDMFSNTSLNSSLVFGMNGVGREFKFLPQVLSALLTSAAISLNAQLPPSCAPSPSSELVIEEIIPFIEDVTAIGGVAPLRSLDAMALSPLK